jgi:hypothetical protein
MVAFRMLRRFNLLLLLLVLLIVASARAVQASSTVNLSRKSATVWKSSSIQGQDPDLPAIPNAYTKYLPIILKPPSGTQIQVGAEMYSGSDLGFMKKATEANIRWSRNSAVNWKYIEPTRTTPPVYDWAQVSEAEFTGLSSAGIRTIAIVRWAPEWAQKYPGYSCGPIAENALDAFAQFMRAAVTRYSKSPYNVHYWEIGNEPDVPLITNPDGPDSWFGCWGEPDDPYYGGGYYAKMLEKVYPAIKAADPSAKVILGGLLLDCDPTHPPPGKTCASANFLEGVLINNGNYNGANYFDMVSYHGYPGYDGTLLVDENKTVWTARGGVAIGKADFLREVMARYGVDKPLFHSEGSLLCPESYPKICGYPTPGPGQDFYEAQADYAVWLFVRDWANGIWGTSWFQFEGPGWRYNSLLDGDGNPKPSYYAFQFLTNELGRAVYSQQIGQYPNVRVYEFRTSSKRIWVMWSPDDQYQAIDLPAGVTKVFDKYGNLVSLDSNQVTVKSPLYVEMAP